jgi:23S rRNA (pseudouridine1915-N3)-methyltransferase
MFKAKIICVGKLKEVAYKSLEQEFLKRLHPFAKVVVEELPEVPYRHEGEREKTKRQEAEAILKRVPADAVLILLDERGVERTSEDFSLFIERMASFGRELVFVLGGGLGTDQVIKERANHVVALSKLTFPHNLARIFLEEQIYRACTIIAGKEYHK